MSDLLKKVLPPLNWGYGADSIPVGEWDYVIFAYVVWFKDQFWVFIPPFF